MAEGDYKLVKENASGGFDEKSVAAENGKVLGFDSSKDPVMVDPGGETAATSAEVNTGTDNTKMVTPQAIEGSDYQKMKVQASAPSSPSTGDFWIDSDEDPDANRLFDNVVESYTKAQYFAATSTTRSTTGTYTWDLDSNQAHILTAGANFTLDVSNQRAGATYWLILKQDATGSRAVSFSSNFDFEDGTAPTLDTTASVKHLLGFISDGTKLTLTGVIQKIS